MAGFLQRGGASRASKSPPLAFPDDTAFNHGDVPIRAAAVARAETLGTSAGPLDAEEGSGLRAHVPGYSGFVPSLKEVAGRNFTRCTRRALNKDVRHLLEGAL